MFTKTFEYGSARVTVRRADVRGRLLQSMVFRHFPISEDMPVEEWTLYNTFAEFMTLAVVEGDLGFPIPPLSAPKEAMLVAYEGFMALPETFYNDYLNALNEVNSIIGAVETAPGADEKKEAAATAS